jgi:hypothetical protein
MYDSTFFVLQASQSSQTPSMQWGGFPAFGAPLTWPPPPPAGFWPPSGQATSVRSYSRIQVSLEDLLSHRRVRTTGRHHRRGNLHLEGRCCCRRGDPPFGSPPLRTSPLRPMTFTPPTVCLLDYFAFLICPFRIPNTYIYTSFRVAQDHNKAMGQDMTLLMTSSTRQEDPTATMLCHSSYFAFACCSFSFGFACHELLS